MIYTYPLKPCPWCKETPNFFMLYNDETWLPEIKCINVKCKIRPKCDYVPIRKKQKKNPNIIKEKIERMLSYWNDGNTYPAYEGIRLDFDMIAAQTQLKQEFKDDPLQ